MRAFFHTSPVEFHAVSSDSLVVFWRGSCGSDIYPCRVPCGSLRLHYGSLERALLLSCHTSLVESHAVSRGLLVGPCGSLRPFADPRADSIWITCGISPPINGADHPGLTCACCIPAGQACTRQTIYPHEGSRAFIYKSHMALPCIHLNIYKQSRGPYDSGIYTMLLYRTGPMTGCLVQRG